ncbi:DUF742 domain-containing protein [Streptomyces zhihengii]|uniref:DUF742 domain-containing protein n=1 Tax=Streptomyces zhihengii TaxID=1818004 RepID=A0ABS2V4F8_9ACTN|nr:DUF742 domain-containing protein [Streptomyces zhihengii]MBM9624640.1 DUF742 domain-containing protein [Streptomyces zhihengii]
MGTSGWADGSLGDVRPYTITGGRTRANHTLQLTTCLITRPASPGTVHPSPEGEALLLHCSGAPRSVAELAALSHQPVQVVKVLIGDLLDCDALARANPASTEADPDVYLLEALLHGLRTRL